MPVTSSRVRRRSALAVGVLLFVLLSVLGLVRFGRFLAHEDPLIKADAVFVLAGSEMERALEGADLYKAGWAPRIVQSYGLRDAGIAALARRGVQVPTSEDVARDALIRSGIPAEAFIVPPRIHDNTADEAATAHQLAQRYGWRRLIVVTSKYHLRRAGFAFRRELEGTGVEVVMRGSRYDASDPARWWASRGDIRWMLSEAPKFAAYLLGLGA